MNCPIHDVVCGDERRRDVEYLSGEAPPCVEDGVVDRAGEGVLTVRADTVGNDALLLHAT